MEEEQHESVMNDAAIEQAKRTALAAADNLMGRFQEKGGFFQAWGTAGDPKEYRLIIDCLLNMPLLFWASEVTGNPIYREKAECHIRTAMAHVVRDDYSRITPITLIRRRALP